jgi:hypothetical protein
MIFWGKKWCALNLTNYRKTSNGETAAIAAAGRLFCIRHQQPQARQHGEAEKDASIFKQTHQTAPRRAQAINDNRINTLSAQCYPRHACPLNVSFLMQLRDPS